MEIIPVRRPCTRRISQGALYRRERKGPRGKEICGVSITLPSEEKGKICCKNVCCKANASSYKKTRYIQPARPRSFAPNRMYIKPEQPFEDGTIYRKSYLPVDSERPEMYIPQNNLGLPHSKFATDTIHKMSYPGWNNICPPDKIVPCSHNLLGKGPMDDMTIQRQDYVPKHVIKQDPFHPHNNLFLNNCPFSDKTIHKMSYMPAESEKRQLIIPCNNLELPNAPMDGKTINKMSYQPCKIPKKEFLPWAQKTKYSTPCEKMSGNTIYRNSYIPNKAFEKVEPIRPLQNKNLLGDLRDFDGNTVYHMSYPGNEHFVRPEKIIPTNNIQLSRQKIDGNTIHKMSYLPNACIERPVAVRPCNHDLLGKGPMNGITTQQHDYVPKYIDRVDPFYPSRQIMLSDQPMSNKTTHNLSYMPNNYMELPQKIIPVDNLGRASGKMENNTIHKMSYQPIGRVEKMDMPWAEKRKYCPPSERFFDDTVYRMSYDAPGEFIDDGGNGNTSCECRENTCCPYACPATATACC